MIIEGDGSFERRLKEGRCPKCTGYLERDGDSAWCGVCKLSIHDASRAVVSCDEPCKEDEEADETSNHRYAPYDYL